MSMGLPCYTVVKNPPANVREARDTGLTPGLGRCAGRGNSNPLQYSCLENYTTEDLVGYSPWEHKESDTTEQLSTHTRSMSVK